MNVLINGSNLRKGGSLHILEIFVRELKKITNMELLVFTNSASFKLIKPYEGSSTKVISFELPSKMGFGASQRKMSAHAIKFEPDIIFSPFGPTYWRPPSKFKHLVGFANSYFTDIDSPFWKHLNIIHRLLIFFKKVIFFIYLNREADFFLVQTMRMKKGLVRWLKIKNNKKVFVIPNCYNKEVVRPKKVKNKRNSKEIYNIGFLSAYYRHKNFTIIPKVITACRDLGVKIKFVATLPDYEFKNIFKDEVNKENIINIGPIPHNSLMTFYDQIDCVFFPSLLESYSSVYNEARVINLPLVVPDLEFVSEIVGNYGLYYNAEDHHEAARQIYYALRGGRPPHKNTITRGSGVKPLPSSKIACSLITVLKNVINW